MRIAARPVVLFAGAVLTALAVAGSARAEDAPSPEKAAPVDAPTAEIAPATAEDKELAWARATNDPREIASASIAVGRAHVAAGDPKAAMAPLEEALRLANGLRDDGLARSAALSIGDAYHALREYGTAERWVERANTYRDKAPGRFAGPAGSESAQEPAQDAAVAPAGAASAAPERTPTVGEPPRSAPPKASPAPDPGSLEQLLRRMRWLLALLAVLLAGMLWITLRRSAQLRTGAGQTARERRMLETVHRTLRQATEQSRQIARADTLTGALNRDSFAKELEAMLAHGQRLSRPVTLMVIDLDHFKEINDRHGHLAGDAALGLAVVAMRQQLDEGMLIGRYGGDEFLVACFDRTREQALQLAERIRTQVRGRSAESPEPAVRGITLSIGVAMAQPGTAHAVEALFQRADAALYAAKKAGRDRVDLADDPVK